MAWVVLDGAEEVTQLLDDYGLVQANRERNADVNRD